MGWGRAGAASWGGRAGVARRIGRMSYVVLARKYRPRHFGEMVGQAHVVQALGNALTTGRLHHAYLFTGTRGVGKTTIARIFAKSLNCERGTSAEPCGECNACRDIDAGRFMDLLEIDAASNTGVDDVLLPHQLGETLGPPFAGEDEVGHARGRPPWGVTAIVPRAGAAPAAPGRPARGRSLVASACRR